MECPYCAKEISDQALVCPHCTRDLILFRPIAARCSRAEQNLLNASLSMRSADVAPTVAFASSVLLAFFFDLISWQPFADGRDTIWQVLSVVSPFFAALGLGAFSPRLKSGSYMALGLVSGVAGFAQQILVWPVGALQSAYNHNSCCAPFHPKYWYVSFLVYSVVGILLFLSGSTFGLALRFKFFPKRAETESSGDPARSNSLAPYWQEILEIGGDPGCSNYALPFSV